MYKFIRSLIFLLHPETAHELTFSMIKWASVFPGISFTLRKVFTIEHPALEKKLLGLTFKNPVGLAAGFDKDACLFNELADFGFGFIEIGTVTPKAQQGNPEPRLFRIVQDSAIINRMGFNNHGVEHAVQKLKQNKHKVIVGGNIGKNTATPNDKAIDDYVYCFNALFDYVDYFVVNVSCPNIKELHEIQDKGPLLDILDTLKKLNSLKPQPKPILLKIAPDLSNTQLDEIIDIVRETKIDGIVATNTTIKRDGLSLSQQKIKRIGNGGLSGRPLAKRSTEVIRYLSEQLGKDFPIIGVGGIMTVEDAIEKLEAGAALIQIYTGFIYKGPFFAKQICKEILKERDQWIPMS